MNRYAGVLLVSALALQGCVDPVTLGAVISGINGGWQLADRFAASDAEAVKTICQRWAVDKATAAQRVADGKVDPMQAQRAADLEPWLDGACNPATPPSTDPLGAVVWIAGLIAEHDLLTQAP